MVARQGRAGEWHVGDSGHCRLSLTRWDTSLKWKSRLCRLPPGTRRTRPCVHTVVAWGVVWCGLSRGLCSRVGEG